MLDTAERRKQEDCKHSKKKRVSVFLNGIAPGKTGEETNRRIGRRNINSASVVIASVSILLSLLLRPFDINGKRITDLIMNAGGVNIYVGVIKRAVSDDNINLNIRKALDYQDLPIF